MHKNAVLRIARAVYGQAFLPGSAAQKGRKRPKYHAKLCKMYKTLMKNSLNIVMKKIKNLLHFWKRCCIMIGLDMRWSERLLWGDALKGNFRGVCPRIGRRYIPLIHGATCGIVLLQWFNFTQGKRSLFCADADARTKSFFIGRKKKHTERC